MLCQTLHAGPAKAYSCRRELLAQLGRPCVGACDRIDVSSRQIGCGRCRRSHVLNVVMRTDTTFPTWFMFHTVMRFVLLCQSIGDRFDKTIRNICCAQMLGNYISLLFLLFLKTLSFCVLCTFITLLLNSLKVVLQQFPTVWFKSCESGAVVEIRTRPTPRS